jgi:general secretion pathway protein D
MKSTSLSLTINARVLLIGIGASIALATVVAGQPPPVKPPVALPEPVLPLPAKPETNSETLRAAEANVVEKQPAAAGNPAVIPNAASSPVKPPKGNILLNFQGAALTDVLNYLSEAAGFVIIQEAPVSGTVNVVSRQPISAEEAVDLLNAVLIEKGYVAIRNGRILKIVNRKDAQRRELPVATGSDPSQIPRKDEMVTQILPLRHGEAAKLVENLRPLLADSSTISANEGSNSILLTDTQTNIRRIAEIIQAIDTSVGSISTIKVYALHYASATQLATVITQLYTSNTASTNQRNRGRGGFGGFGFGGPGGGPPGGGSSDSSAQSEARQAASRVVAVADDQSNSLIVCAPDNEIPVIEDIVRQIDTSINDVTDTRIFRLQHADASETAEIINTLYSDTSTSTNNNQGRNRNNQNRNGRGGGFGGPFGNPFGQQQNGNNNSQQSERALLQSKVVAVGDPRTNSLLVIAGRDTMADIAEMVGRLDSTDARKQHVYVHSLEHADAETVANVLRGMLGDQTATNAASQSGSGRLTERSANGATMDTSDFTNSNRSGR